MKSCTRNLVSYDRIRELLCDAQQFSREYRDDVRNDPSVPYRMSHSTIVLVLAGVSQ